MLRHDHHSAGLTLTEGGLLPTTAAIPCRRTAAMPDPYRPASWHGARWHRWAIWYYCTLRPVKKMH